MAGKTVLTEALQEEICKTLSCGIDVETACLREGISRSTYYGWRKRGEAGEEPFASFLEATDAAMAEVEKEVTHLIVRAAKVQWQAGAWWLRFRKSGGKQQVELTGPGGAPLAMQQLTREQADEIRRKIIFGEGDEPAEGEAGGEE